MTLRLRLVETSDAARTYAFGVDGAEGAFQEAGRVEVDPDSGDVALLTLHDDAPPPGARFLLAESVDRLQALHAEGAFPPEVTWKV